MRMSEEEFENFCRMFFILAIIKHPDVERYRELLAHQEMLRRKEKIAELMGENK